MIAQCIERVAVKLALVRDNWLETPFEGCNPAIINLVIQLRICARRGKRFPRSLIVMGDNTVRELKNSFNILYLGSLIGRRKVRLASLHFLRKSHTHDRIDQLPDFDFFSKILCVSNLPVYKALVRG